MAQSKVQKKKIVEELTDKIAKQKTMVFFDFTGLKVKELSRLRKKIKSEGGDVKIAKKSLLSLVLKKVDIALNPKKLKGQIGLAFGFENEISPAKICYQFSQENPNLKILGGFFEKEIADAVKVIELAQLPSKEGLLAKIFFLPNWAVFNNLMANLGKLSKVKT